MDKKFWLILGVIVAVMIGLFALSGGKSDTSNTRFEGNAREIQSTDKILGSADSPVVLIEYGDFQCPGCGALFPALQQVKQEFSQDLAFIFRHFPLSNIHPNAMAAHRAAEAAAKQGKFWEMHDMLFTRQQQWSTVSNAPATFAAYAEELGLNMDQYSSDVASQEVFDIISRDLDSGKQVDVTGTPTLLINGERVATPSSIEELRQLVQEAINESQPAAEPSADTPSEDTE